MNSLKKLCSLLLACLMAVSVFTYPLSFIAYAETVTTLYIDGTGVRVRSAPNTSSSKIITTVSNRSATVLETVKETASSTEYTWYKITFTTASETITGYVRFDSSYMRVVTTEYNEDATFEEKLEAFPESYHELLKKLHSIYPNWEFVADEIDLTFSKAVAMESVNNLKQVNMSGHPVSWRSMSSGYYDWDEKTWISTNGGWTGASKEIIAYYMDPRNFLNTDSIYQFLQQGYDPALQTEEGLAKIVEGTFLAGTYKDSNDTKYGGSYVKVIMAAAEASGVSPYIIAAKILQEQGTSGKTSLISGTYSGYEGYYNFFNFNAYGSSTSAVIVNGLKYAKNMGWNTRSAAIIGGAKSYSSSYISAGQDTFYYQDFDVLTPDSLHQYAQNVADAYQKGLEIAETYSEGYNYTLTFRIPVFKDMPNKVSEMPKSSSKKNNYYFADIEVAGLTPSFVMYGYEYDLYVKEDTTITVTPVEGASYYGYQTYNVTKGDNTIPLRVISETGYITTYNLSVNAENDCVITVNCDGKTVTPKEEESSNQSSSSANSNSSSSTSSKDPSSSGSSSKPSSSTSSKPSSNPSSSTSSTVKVKKGDTNGDNKITLSDLANIRLHLLGKYVLKGNNALAADTNSDGKISLTDLANVRLHLLGLYTIK